MPASQLVNTVAFSLGITTEQLFNVVAQNLDMGGQASRMFLDFIHDGTIDQRVRDYLNSFVATEEELCRTP